VILRKGTTLNQLCNANPQMNGVSHWEGIASALGDVAIEQTCVGLMTCNIIAETRNKSFDEQSALIKNLGCAIPTIYPYLAVCSTASSNKVYSDTYAFSSTQLEDCLLIAGFCAAYMKVFSVSGLSPNSAPSENRGAGAWLPLDCALSKKD
jgi:hypothetical protein